MVKAMKEFGYHKQRNLRQSFKNEKLKDNIYRLKVANHFRKIPPILDAQQDPK